MSNPNTSLDLDEILADLWNDAMTQESGSDWNHQKLLKTKTAILEWVEKEVIGEDEPIMYKAGNNRLTKAWRKAYRNDLRAEQRRRLR